MARPALKPVDVPKAAVAEDWDAAPDTVRVRCIVHTHPHTHERWLAYGEVAVIPADVAKLMIERKQVEHI